jgi:hypothetical protein
MTTHPGEGTLQALLDEEVPPQERAELERHLAGCPACAAEMDALRDASAVLASSLRLLDLRLEPEAVQQARWRLEHARRAGRRSAGWGGTTVRRAALLVVGSAAVLSATVPGSPVRSWLRGADAPAVARVEEAERTTTLAPPVDDAAPAGVSLLPTQGRMRVELRGLAPGVRLRVQLTDGERVGVWASGAAAQARFRTAPERIEVEGAPAGEIRVEVPRSTERFALEVNGRPYLFKQGEQLRFPGPAADTAGPEILFEVRP